MVCKEIEQKKHDSKSQQLLFALKHPCPLLPSLSRRTSGVFLTPSMDDIPEAHAAACSDDANSDSPFELDYTPSMRVVGVAQKQPALLQPLVSDAGDKASSKRDASNGEIDPSSVPPCEADYSDPKLPVPEVLLSGLTSLTLDHMSGLQIAQFAAKCAGICCAECVAAIQDLYMTRDMQGYRNWNEGYLRVSIGDAPHFAANTDHLNRIVGALLQMKAVVDERDRPTTPSPRKSHIR